MRSVAIPFDRKYIPQSSLRSLPSNGKCRLSITELRSAQRRTNEGDERNCKSYKRKCAVEIRVESGSEEDHHLVVSGTTALQATILTLPGSGPTISLLFSSLKVGFLRMNVQTFARHESVVVMVEGE